MGLFWLPTDNQRRNSMEGLPRNLKFHHPNFIPKRIPSSTVWSICLLNGDPSNLSSGQPRPARGIGWRPTLALRKEMMGGRSVIPRPTSAPEHQGEAESPHQKQQADYEQVLRQCDWASLPENAWTKMPLFSPWTPSPGPEWVPRWDMEDWKAWRDEGSRQVQT